MYGEADWGVFSAPYSYGRVTMRQGTSNTLDNAVTHTEVSDDRLNVYADAGAFAIIISDCPLPIVDEFGIVVVIAPQAIFTFYPAGYSPE